MRDAVVIAAVRSPIGRGGVGGALHAMAPAELLAGTVRGLLTTADIDPHAVDAVFVAAHTSGGAGSVGRLACRAAGLRGGIPVLALGRRNGSSLQAIQLACHAVAAGTHDVVLAAAVAHNATHQEAEANGGSPSTDTLGPSVLAAELTAARWKLARPQLDEYAARSHRRAGACTVAGDFREEIVPAMARPESPEPVEFDECVAPSGMTADQLAHHEAREPVADTGSLFPETYAYTVTTGNSAPSADGSCALLIMSSTRADALGLAGKARISTFAATTFDAFEATDGVIRATRLALARAGRTLHEMDHYEIDESFASVALAWQTAFDAKAGLLNPRGGAIAMGNPVGTGGGRSIVTMVGALKATGGRYGIVAGAEGDGTASAAIVERL